MFSLTILRIQKQGIKDSSTLFLCTITARCGTIMFYHSWVSQPCLWRCHRLSFCQSVISHSRKRLVGRQSLGPCLQLQGLQSYFWHNCGKHFTRTILSEVT